MKRIVLPTLCVLLAAAAPAASGEDAADRAKAIEKDLVALVSRISKAYVMIGGGSGVVITPDGWMLTNDHVIDQQRKKKKWPVMLPIHKPYVADLMGKDTTGDIALLKIRGAKNLPHVPLGDSDALRAGQLVVALGNPYSHAFRTAEPTVTFGIVSATHRNQVTYSDAIQTDAPVNPGNSGGPLINLKGELVGINGRVRVRFGQKFNTGVGLAIPANQIRRFLPLLKKGDVYHGDLTGLRFPRSRSSRSPLTVERVSLDTVADRAGFEAGDRVLSVGGLPVWNLMRFQGAVRAYPEGAEVPVTVERDGREVEVTATLVRWYPRGAPRLTADRMKPGLGAKLNPEAPVTGGAEIKEVLPNSAASKAGLRAGDIILRFDGKQVLGPGDLDTMIRGIYAQLPPRGTRRNRDVKVGFLRGLEEKEVTVSLGPRPKD
jgi:serine protease Do